MIRDIEIAMDPKSSDILSLKRSEEVSWKETLGRDLKNKLELTRNRRAGGLKLF